MYNNDTEKNVKGNSCGLF